MQLPCNGEPKRLGNIQNLIPPLSLQEKIGYGLLSEKTDILFLYIELYQNNTISKHTLSNCTYKSANMYINL